MRDFMIIVETGQAPLFHGTELANALMIIQSDTIVATKTEGYSTDPQGVSLSRSHRFAREWGKSSDTGYGAVFVLDRSRLAQRFRIVPHAAEPDRGWASGETQRHEAEEVVLGTIAPLSRYLVSVNVDPEHLDHLLGDEAVFSNWFRAIHDLLGYCSDDEARAMLLSLQGHPLLNRLVPK